MFEISNILVAAVLILSTGFLTKAGERLFEWADGQLTRRRQQRE